MRRVGDEARKTNRNKTQDKTNTTPWIPVFCWEFLEKNREKAPEWDIGGQRCSSLISSLKYHWGYHGEQNQQDSFLTEPVED